MSGRARRLVIGVAAALAVGSWAFVQRAAREAGGRLSRQAEALRPLHHPLPEPGPGDWLAEHPEPGPGDWLAEHPEPGQTFAQYLAADPVRAVAGQRTVYLQPIGDFTAGQTQIIATTADFIGRFYGLPVKVLEALPASAVPSTARRTHPTQGMPQVLTTFVMQELLIPRRPVDAVAMLAFTAEDLYPAPDWNFVFGEASVDQRVGVWSLYRNGDLAREPTLYLLRTLKTSVHELAHMLSLRHYTAFACVMNGSNNLEEADGQPLELCPVCLTKVAWNTGVDVEQRFRTLEAYSADAGLEENRALMERSLEVSAAVAR